MKLEGNKTILTFTTNGIEETIFKYVTEEIEQTSELIQNLSELEIQKEITSGNYSIDYEKIYNNISEKIKEDNVKLKNEYVGIIHGRSSNILRDKAHEILKLNKNVDSFKVDIFNPGMTIVKIKFRK